MEKRVRRIFESFQSDHPGVTFRLVTGTPGKMVKRMKAGARPDVYISMGPIGVKVLTSMGIARQGSAREILRQRMTLICTEAMKGKVWGLQDLAGPDVRRVGLGRATLTAGTYSRRALSKLGILEKVAAKSQISPLRSYMCGKVDAAIVLGECCYGEDLLMGRVAPRRGIGIVGPLPVDLCPEFPIVAVAIKGQAPPEVAQQFINFLTQPAPQEVLRRKGVEACPVCEGEKCAIPR